jgi:hypothetical protein
MCCQCFTGTNKLAEVPNHSCDLGFTSGFSCGPTLRGWPDCYAGLRAWFNTEIGACTFLAPGSIIQCISQDIFFAISITSAIWRSSTSSQGCCSLRSDRAGWFCTSCKFHLYKSDLTEKYWPADLLAKRGFDGMVTPSVTGVSVSSNDSMLVLCQRWWNGFEQDQARCHSHLSSSYFPVSIQLNLKSLLVLSHWFWLLPLSDWIFWLLHVRLINLSDSSTSANLGLRPGFQVLIDLWLQPFILYWESEKVRAGCTVILINSNYLYILSTYFTNIQHFCPSSYVKNALW